MTGLRRKKNIMKILQKNSAIIFTERGRGIGSGHFSRCQILKTALENQKISVKMHVFENIKNARAELFARKCLAHKNSWLFGTNLCDILENQRVFLIVIDSYLAELWQYFFAKKHCEKLLILDDNARIKFPKNAMILNPAFGAESMYEAGFRRIFAGISYAFFNSNLREKIPQKFLKNSLKNILIFLGGHDAKNLTQKIADALQNLTKSGDIKCKNFIFLLGSESDFLLKIDEKILPHQILKNIAHQEVFTLLKRVDFAILSGGGVLNEAIFCHTPCAILQTAKNQNFQIKMLKNFGAIIKIEEKNLQNDIKNALNLSQKDYQNLQKIMANIPIGEKFFEFLHEIFS